ITAGTAAIALGPLNPPAGPVTETTPSLAEIKTTLDQLAASQTGSALADGPFLSFKSHESGDFAQQLTSTPVVDGPVYIHDLIVYRADASLFEGQGAITANGRALTTNWFARSTQSLASSGTGRAQLGTVVVPVRQVITGNVEAAWSFASEDGYVNILYTPLTGANP
ncbi:MAG: hypothetical protein AAGA55_09820, partial [Planctomycetota bacterium]